MDKIVIVEDDDNIRELVCYALSSAQFETIGLENGDRLLTILKDTAPSLVILDLMLPGDDGLTLLHKIKTAQTAGNIPIIMLTAKGSEVDRVKGLDLGADDYITKPFSVLELVSRVKAVLRRCTVHDPQSIRIRDVLINPGRRSVNVDENEIALTYKEFELLLYLANNKGLVISRDKLMENIWGFDFEGESRTLDMHIKTLRHKLMDAGGIIKTVRNVGYKIED